MLQRGLEPVFSIDEFNINGFVEPLKRLPRLLRRFRQLRNTFLARGIDVVVGIDFSFFNLRLEETLKKRGIPSVHYVSPSVWAWRRGRIRRIRRATDLMMTLFPFEEKLYKEHNVNALYVGHPLADSYEVVDNDNQLKCNAKANLGLLDARLVLTVMPGSRKSELVMHTALFLNAVRIVCEQHPTMKVLIPMPDSASREYVQSQLKAFPELDVEVLVDQSQRALAAADVVLIKSGTTTLEAMLLRKSMVVSYRLGRLTYFIVMSLLRTRFVALPNILAETSIVPEILQDEATPITLARCLLKKLEETDEQRASMFAQFKAIHNDLRRNSSTLAANGVIATIAA